MKKIKSIGQLREEKRRIREKEKMLEGRIQENWASLKSGMRPMNVVIDILGSVFQKKTADAAQGSGLVKDAVVYGVSFLASKFLNRKKRANAASNNSTD